MPLSRGSGSRNAVQTATISGETVDIPAVILADANGNTQTGTYGQKVEGTSANNAADDGSNPVKVGGIVASGLATSLPDGRRNNVLLDTTGAQWVSNYASSATITGIGANIAFAFCAVGGAAAGRPVASAGVLFNGTSFDVARKPNGFVRIASTAASGNPGTAKASAGDLFSFYGLNSGAITYFQLYNKASNPVLGTDTPLLTLAISASAAFTIPSGLHGSYFSNGIAYAFTTDAAGATGAAAGAVTSFGLAYA